MNIVDYPIMSPGVCFICEMTNPGRYIDTLRSFEPGGVTKLNGRKYVCEHCVAGLADYLGWASPERYWNLEEMLTNLQAELTKTQEELIKYERIVETIELIKEVKNDGSERNRRKAGSSGRS